MNKNDRMYERIKRALDKKPVSISDYKSEMNKFQSQPQPPKYVIGRNRRRVSPVYQTPVPPVSDNSIYISGSCIGISGYDNLVYETIKGLRSVGLDVRINANNSINYSVCPAWFKDIHMPKPPEAWEILITPPCNFPFVAPGPKSVVLTMWETDELDKQWVELLNGAHMVCVPSQWAVDSFAKCGVGIPITKTPLGYDPLIFTHSDKFPEICTFGTAAALTAGGLRKNTNYIISLFQKEFPTETDVRLKVKITPACPMPSHKKDSRIEIIQEMLPPTKLVEWYKSITTFVNGSFAEGFGLHLIEAMACGRPLISTAYSAVTEYFDDEVGWTVDHEIIPASGGAYAGHWGKPVGESIMKQMRHVYENKKEVKDKGEAAYLRARNFMWKDFGQKLLAALTDHGVVKA